MPDDHRTRTRMSTQRTFAGLAWSQKGKVTRRGRFLAEMGRVVREVNPKGETVWEFNLRTDPATGQKSDLPEGMLMGNNQTAERLANGNTIICASTGGAKGEERIKRTQVIEVAPDKKIVWALQDWKNLGPATTVQLLDEPGVPENPGELQR